MTEEKEAVAEAANPVAEAPAQETVLGGTEVEAEAVAATKEGETVLGATDDGEGADGSAADADAKAGDADDQEGAPEAYEAFTLPEGFSDDILTEEFLVMAKEMNLSQPAAQKLIDVYMRQIGQLADAGAKQADDQWTTTTEGWLAEAKADKDMSAKFDEHLGKAKKAIDAHGNQGLKDVLNKSGLGNHPEVIRFLSKVGAELGEDNLDLGQGTGGGEKDTRSAAEKMFPSMTGNK